MDVDQALTSAGPLGRVQILVTIAACLSQVQSAWIAISTVFISETPQHSCASSPGFVLNESNPFKESNRDQCEEYAVPSEWNSTRPCANGWEYDTDLTGKSIVSDWDLVCARDYLPDLSQSIIVVGFAIGAVSAGPLADRFGRRSTQLISLIIFIFLGLAVSLSPNYVTYVSLRFAMGAVMMIHKIPMSTMQCEYMIPKHRSIMGSIPFLISALGTIMMSGIAYYVRDWRVIPESVRWIMSKGDVITAEKTMKQIAKLNRADTYQAPVFLNHCQMEENTSFLEASSNQGMLRDDTRTTDSKKVRKTPSIREIFNKPTVTVTCILSWCWTVNLLTYFGFALSVGTLAGNIYLNFFLIALVELPARTISLIIVKNGKFPQQLVVNVSSLAWKIFRFALNGTTKSNDERAVSYLSQYLLFQKFGQRCRPASWQRWKLVSTFSSLHEISPHHCAVAPGYTLNETVPVDEDGAYVRCEEYVNSSVSKETQPCSNGWEYDTELFGESITSEWDLVCSKDYLPDLSQSILLAGFAAGSIIAGQTADKYGRKPTILVAVILVNILGILISFSPNYVVFVSLRFALGVVYKAINIPVTTMMYESLLPKHRSTFGNIPPLMATLGLMLMAGLAALVRDWFYFNLVIMTPMDKFVSNLSLIFMTSTSFVSAFLCLFLPETLNTTQPETPADLKILFETRRVFSFGKKSHNNSMSIKDEKFGLEDARDKKLEDVRKMGTKNEGFEPEKRENGG
ncbi:Solute carrier family 22 member 6-A [Holothuria leucospilota]|uniref:Solute carrier family 22 member 6-A n=1 Tax=Holothuria leucospilota TaxID=206669 RepID=A0A9Q1BT51_HOLLE|nr:Solute carrier family 22 member 6-A [Holothuria leucospilota]